jgi:hypothetical protein
MVGGKPWHKETLSISELRERREKERAEEQQKAFSEFIAENLDPVFALSIELEYGYWETTKIYNQVLNIEATRGIILARKARVKQKEK